MKRRIGAWTAALALILALLPAARADAATIAVKPPGAPVKAGETFTVTVELTGNPGFCVVQFVLVFDKQQMQCTGISTGALLNGVSVVTNADAPDGAVIAAVTTNAVQGDGVIATFQFRAISDSSEYAFQLDRMGLYDFDNHDIPYTLTGATEIKPTPAPTSAPAGSGGTTTQPKTPEELAQQNGETQKPNEQKPTDETQKPNEQTPADETKPTDETAQAPDEPAASVPETGRVTFTDAATHWGAGWIGKAVAYGLFTGYPDGSFRPDANITRADYVLVLWRAWGSPEAAKASSFTDVSASAYYADAVAWAEETGCVNGKGEGSFDPSGSLTRQEAMKILFSLSGGVSGMEGMFTQIYDASFSDSAAIADWAKSAMYWAYYNEIINGMGDGLNPTGQATRAQLAKILVNYMDNVNK